MMTFRSTPTGGIGQPLRPSRRMYPAGACRNDHANPERDGDCNCGELAAERAEAAEARAVAATEPRTIRHYAPSRVVRVPSRFTVDVVGVSFAPDYPANLQRLSRQQDNGVTWELELVREPANAVDPNAVAVVVAADASVLGHVPAALAGRLAPAMDAGGRWAVTGWKVLVTKAHPDRPGLQLAVERVGAAEMSQPAATLRLAS